MLSSQHLMHKWERTVVVVTLRSHLTLTASLQEGETQRLRNLSKAMPVPAQAPGAQSHGGPCDTGGEHGTRPPCWGRGTGALRHDSHLLAPHSQGAT